ADQTRTPRLRQSPRIPSSSSRPPCPPPTTPDGTPGRARERARPRRDGPCPNVRLAKWLELRHHAAHIGRLQPLGALADVELHLLVLLQVAKARLLDGAEVHKHIRSAILGDEAISLLGVEPLHHTSCQLHFP